MKLSILGGVAVAALLAAGGCGRTGGSSAAVAMVGKDAITEKQFFDYLQAKGTFSGRLMPPERGQALGVGRLATIQFIDDTPGYQALKDLIINQVTLQLAKENNVYPSDKDVSDAIDLQKERQRDIIEAALSKGVNMDEFKEMFRLDIAKFNLSTKGIKVTTQDATNFIANHTKEFKEPPQIQSQVVVVKKADEANFDHALDSGQSFATVARTYSIDKSAESRGFEYNVNGSIAVKDFPKKIADLLSKTDELRSTPWQDVGKGPNMVGIKFYVQKKAAETDAPRTPLLIETVRKQLALQKAAQQGIDYNKMLLTRLLAMKNSIKINLKQDQAPWDLFMSQVSQALAKTAVNLGPNGLPAGATEPAGAATGAKGTTGAKPGATTPKAPAGATPPPAAKK